MPTNKQLLYILNYHLGLRMGDDTLGAAYGMDDFGTFSEGGNPAMAAFQWCSNPDSDKTRLQAWLDHLHNSVVKIDDLDKGKGFTLLLITKASATAESYSVSHNGKGDNKTFKKCNRAQADSQIVAKETFQSGEIDKAVTWALQNIPEK